MKNFKQYLKVIQEMNENNESLMKEQKENNNNLKITEVDDQTFKEIKEKIEKEEKIKILKLNKKYELIPEIICNVPEKDYEDYDETIQEYVDFMDSELDNPESKIITYHFYVKVIINDNKKDKKIMRLLEDENENDIINSKLERYVETDSRFKNYFDIEYVDGGYAKQLQEIKKITQNYINNINKKQLLEEAKNSAKEELKQLL